MKVFLNNIVKYFKKDGIKDKIKDNEEYKSLSDEIISTLNSFNEVEPSTEPIEPETQDIVDYEIKFKEIEERISNLETFQKQEKVNLNKVNLSLSKDNLDLETKNLDYQTQIELLKTPTETPTIPGVEIQVKSEVTEFKNHYEFLKSKGVINF